MNEYDVGDRIRVGMSTPFSANGVSFDPDVVTFTIKLPSGTETTYTYGTDPEVTKNAVGDYEMEIDADMSGIYRYVIKGETSELVNQGAYHGALKVLRSYTG